MTTETQEIGIGYLKTLPGILKIGEEVLNFVGMICVAAGGSSGRGTAFLICSIVALIVTGALIICYVTQLVVKIQLPWYRIEFFFYAAWIVFYIVVSSLVLTAGGGGAYITGGVFGLLATACYIADAYHKFRLVMAS